MIKPVCDKCGGELVTFGGLAFSAPDTKPDGSAFRCVDKYHLCIACFESFKSWLDYERDATGKVLLTNEPACAEPPVRVVDKETGRITYLETDATGKVLLTKEEWEEYQSLKSKAEALKKP